VHLENTEIGVVDTDRLRGGGASRGKAWCREHRHEYRDVPTYIICFDTIHDPRFLMVNARDLNSTVASDRQLCTAFLSAAAQPGTV
jgi:hypothetical protein